MNQTKEKTTTLFKIQTVIGIILCIILIPILIINVSLIIKSFTNPDEVPSVGGVFPLIVLTDSMYPRIQSGDLIICHTEEPENVQVGDVIAFFDPAGNGTTVVTHQVIEITEKDGDIAWVTQGIANNAADMLPVPAKSLAGVYQSRIGGLGNVVLFMQSSTGLIVCVLLPLLALIAYDMIRRKMYEKANREDTDALLKELEELRRLKAEAENRQETPAAAEAVPEETPAAEEEASPETEAAPEAAQAETAPEEAPEEPEAPAEPEEAEPGDAPEEAPAEAEIRPEEVLQQV